ncbi:hypothetical protein D3C81_2022150 [compost metagenome]
MAGRADVTTNAGGILARWFYGASAGRQLKTVRLLHYEATGYQKIVDNIDLSFDSASCIR